MEAVPEECLAAWQIGTEGDVSLPWTGTRALMLAVLEDAIRNLGSPVACDRAEAERWIISPEQGYVFSFIVICETLKLSPKAVRRSLLRRARGTQQRDRFATRARSNVRHTANIYRQSDRRRVA